MLSFFHILSVSLCPFSYISTRLTSFSSCVCFTSSCSTCSTCAFFYSLFLSVCPFLFWVVFDSTWTSSPSSAAYWPGAELPSESIGWERGVPQLYWLEGTHSNWPPALYSRAAAHFPCRGKPCVQCERVSWKSTPSTTGGLNDRLTDWLLHSQFTFTLMIRFKTTLWALLLLTPHPGVCLGWKSFLPVSKSLLV